MNKETIIEFFSSQFPGEFLVNEPLSLHTSYKIGGPADIYTYPSNIDSLIKILQFCEKNSIQYEFVGDGANILANDRGYNGIIISLQKNFNSIFADGHFVDAEAGTLLRDLILFCEENSLGGLEYLSGIPGTIGGALVMNAGVDQQEIGNIVEYVKVLDDKLEVQTLKQDDIDFSYRSAPELQNRPILSCRFELKRTDRSSLKEIRESQIKKRKEKQPWQFASCGSVFKRPQGHFVGKMVEDMGLKGSRHGDAMISDKHGGFIINCGKATSGDILFLIKMIRSNVKKEYNITLEPEVRFLGFSVSQEELLAE